MGLDAKLQNVLDCKEAIRRAIEKKGVPCEKEEPLKKYSGKIGQISGGGGGTSMTLERVNYTEDKRTLINIDVMFRRAIQPVIKSCEKLDITVAE